MKDLQCDCIDHVVNNDPEDIITIIITAPRVITEGAVARWILQGDNCCASQCNNAWNTHNYSHKNQYEYMCVFDYISHDGLFINMHILTKYSIATTYC